MVTDGRMTHAELVHRAKGWLRRQGYRVVVGEVSTLAGEIPDAMAFAPTKPSMLVECKASRSDFLADAKKIFRRKPGRGMGRLRYFLTPPGLVQPQELPEGWGLLHAHPRKIEVKTKAAFVDGPLVDRQEGILLTSLLMRVELAHDGGLDALLAAYTRRCREMTAASQERSKALRERQGRRIKIIEQLGEVAA